MTSSASTPRVKVKVFPAYMYVGTPLPGEIKKMSVGEREDFLVENLADFLHQFCDHKKVKMVDIAKHIQTELNKMYHGKKDDASQLAVLNNKKTETTIWDTIAPKIGCITFTQYVLYSV